MEVTVRTEYSKGDRVWMPDGKGGREKGRVTAVVIAWADITDPKAMRMKTIYECENFKGEKSWHQEWNLAKRDSSPRSSGDRAPVS